MKDQSLWIVLAAIVLCANPGFPADWTPLPVESDPLLRMPGTQPARGVLLSGPGQCLNCHEIADNLALPGFNWKGSMMAQAMRDPMLWACLTVAAQDSIWALGNPNATDLCLRCHTPGGWLGGRSDPTNGAALSGTDFDGIYCESCHRMWDPHFEDTYTGLREGNDWSGYWDEATTLSQTSAATTRTADVAESGQIALFHGAPFYVGNKPRYATYTEAAGGQFFVNPNDVKRASFADANATHQMMYSRFHKSKYFCATCHDVSNPALANLGLSGLTDQAPGIALISEQYPAHRYFHVERTFSEFMLSEYGRQGGAATNPELQQQGGVAWAAKCQDCHMADTTGRACDKKFGVDRPSGSTEHPNSGQPVHDMTGGNVWISHILATLDPSTAVYDAVNFAILGQGPSVLTLDLAAGDARATANGAALLAGAQRAAAQLRMAATLQHLAYDPLTGDVSFRILNNTAHKLISGFPEGRRMFINVRAYDDDALVYEVNPYAMTAGTLKGLPRAASSPALGPHEAYADELVFEVHPTSELTGEEETFHFVLATGRYKDNRIPPRGFDIGAAASRHSEPVWHGAVAPDYFSAEEYAGGYHDVTVPVAAGADRISVTLYYQGTSREYIEFLRDEINGTGGTLFEPSPSGLPTAYLVQTDPFFARLRAWGNAIWALWEHNHGLDGSGVQVPGIVPFAMATAVHEVEETPTPAVTQTPTDTPTNTPSFTFTPTATPTYRCLCAVAPVSGDMDADGVPDAAEFDPDAGSPATGSNRYLWDSDGDGLADGVEDADANGARDAGELDPRRRDTDGDGVWDSVELRFLGTDPLDPGDPALVPADGDQDGLPVGLDPDDGAVDADGDGFTDGIEAVLCGLATASDAGAQPPLGDANCDGSVSNLDALIVASIQLQLVPHGMLAGEGQSDANRDGFASNLDALILNTRFLALIPYLPVPAF